eukprot:jgi/Bigna1/56563/estExt_Genewise1Plus.C_1040022
MAPNYYPRLSRKYSQRALAVMICALVVVIVAVCTTLGLEGSTPTRNQHQILGQETKTKKRAHKSRSSRAGLSFPVGRIASKLRKGNYGERISTSAAVMMAAVTEYLTAEVLELAGNAATVARKSRIIPRHIFLGVQTDEELSKYMDNIIFHQGGVLPQVIAPPKSKKKKVDDAAK